MGNCLRHEKASWDDEDWGSLSMASTSSTHHRSHCRYGDDDDDKVKGMEEERLLGANGSSVGNSSSSSSSSCREVKITISKKELQQLVQKVGVQGLTLEQLLATMVNTNTHQELDHHDDDDHIHIYEPHHHRSWRPVLQSIPEVN